MIAEGLCSTEDNAPAAFRLYVEDAEIYFLFSGQLHIFEKPGGLFDYLEKNKITLPDEDRSQVNALVGAGFEFIKYFAEYVRMDTEEYLAYGVKSDVIIDDPTPRIREMCNEYVKDDYVDVVFKLVLSSTLELVEKAKEICYANVHDS